MHYCGNVYKKVIYLKKNILKTSKQGKVYPLEMSTRIQKAVLIIHFNVMYVEKHTKELGVW